MIYPGYPLHVDISPANEHDSKKSIPILKKFLKLLTKNQRQEIKEYLADKAYDAEYIRNYLEKCGIKPRIPYKENSKNPLAKKQDKKQNAERSPVEHSFGWQKRTYRGIETRHAKKAQNYLAMVQLACADRCFKAL